MFAKLLKHEFQATKGTLGVLTLAMLGVGLVAPFTLRAFTAFGNQLDESDSILAAILMFAMGGLMMVFAVSLAVYMLVVLLNLLNRFYKNKFTDEGYLTFTLPVSTEQIFWSSFLNMLIWLVIATVVLIVVIFWFILFGTAQDGIINTEVFTAIGEMFEIFNGPEWEMIIARIEEQLGGSLSGMGTIMLLLMLVSPFYAIIVPMACITVGSTFAKKHKLLCAFGIYYGINAVTSVFTNTFSSVMMFVTSDVTQVMGMLNGSLVLALIVSLALTIGGYFLTIGLMKKKLNLP